MSKVYDTLIDAAMSRGDNRVYIFNEGGSRSGKTYDTFLFLIDYLYNTSQSLEVYALRATLVECKDYTMGDFKACLRLRAPLIGDIDIKGESSRPECSIGNSVIKFRGLDKMGAREGFPSDIIFINELLSGVSKEQFDAVTLRCKRMVISDWNPKEVYHWAFDYEGRPNTIFTHTTYRDNPHCPPAVRSAIEAYEPTPENIRNKTADDWMWKVYGLGIRAPMEGVLYEYGFRTWETQPISYSVVKKCQVDPADSGDNYFCAVFYDEHTNYYTDERGKEKRGVTGMYVTDILFTQKNTDYTEPMMAAMLKKNSTQRCRVESNNGGRSIKKNIEEKTRMLGNSKTTMIEFPQKLNKQLKILNNAPDAQNLIYFPVDWDKKWPEFHKQLLGMRKDGRNAFDDAADVISEMVVEATGHSKTSVLAEMISNNQ